METQLTHQSELSLSSNGDSELELIPSCAESFENLELDAPIQSSLTTFNPLQSLESTYTERQLDELQRFYEELDLLRRQLIEQSHYDHLHEPPVKATLRLKTIRSRVCTICTICQQRIGRGKAVSYAGSRVVRLKCGHVHHGKCIKEWRKVRNNCPLCRQDI